MYMVAVYAGAQLQPDIPMAQGIEHPIPSRVYLRSLEHTSARTAHVRGQGHAWKGTFVVFPASWVSGCGLTEGLLGGGGDCEGTRGDAFQVDPSFKTTWPP